ARGHPHLLRRSDFRRGKRRSNDSTKDAAHTSTSNAARDSSHHTSHRRRRSLVFLDHLYFVRDLGWGAELIVDDFRLDLYHVYRSCRWWGWWWRRRWRRNQKGHELLFRQRLRIDKRDQNQNTKQKYLQSERQESCHSALGFDSSRRFDQA